MEGLAAIDYKNNKNVQNLGMGTTWMTSFGEFAFLCFKNTSENPYTLNVTIGSPDNVTIRKPQGT